MAKQEPTLEENMNLYGIVIKSLKIPITCKKCIFFKKQAIYGKPCQQLGQLPDSDPCGKVQPDATLLDPYGDSFVRDFLKAVGGVESKHLDLLATIALQAKKSNKFGSKFKIGQTVYIHAVGKDYANNYMKGVVMGITRERVGLVKTGGFSYEDKRVKTQDNRKEKPIRTILKMERKVEWKECLVIRGKEGWTGRIYSSSALSHKEWKEKCLSLVKKQKLNDPANTAIKVAKRSAENYNPPMIDKKWESQINRRKKKNNKFPVNVSFVVRGGSVGQHV